MGEGSVKISSLIKNGRLHPAARDAVMKVLSQMEGKCVEIEIKPRKRSLAQNRYRFAVVVATVREALNKELAAQGLPLCDVEDVDLFIKDKALGIVHRIPTKLGELTIQGRLKNKTAAEFEEAMEAIRAYFAPNGIAIPLPHEKDIEQWYMENLER